MTKKLMTVFMALALALALTALAGAESTDKPCPWRISSMSVGKWANGNHKAGVWVKGSFPINIPGVTERPEWFINGSSVGKSQIHFANRWIPNAASRLKAGANTIKVQFNKPPYNGAYHEMTITGFDWGKVPNGGYKWYGAQ